MPNVYTLSASPLSQLAQEEIRTKGFRAVFGVILMFLILCGGVWMLLQSSFGPKQAYLISSVAFWGCWFVLAIVWLIGVPGFKFWKIDIPRSTPQWYGPQGAEARWVAAGPIGDEEPTEKFDEFANDPGNAVAFAAIDASVRDAETQQQAASAASVAQEMVPEAYAVELGIGAADVTVPGVVQVTQIQLAKDGGGYKFARVTFDAATPNATDTQATKDIIDRIEPKTFNLYLEGGSLATPTYYSLALFFVLFAGHTIALARYELNRVPQPQGAPERVPVGV